MASVPHAEKGRDCPLHRCDMSKVCHKCPWWIQIRGKNPQSGEEVDDWNCSIAFLPLLLIDNSRQARGTAAAVETFRNEMVDANSQTARALGDFFRMTTTPNPKLIGS